MKSGQSLQEIAAELTRQKDSKVDYVAPSGKISAAVLDDQPLLSLDGIGEFEVRPYAHRQLATTLGIPQVYYDRMLAQEPTLWARNVDTWLQHSPDQGRMVRTLDHNVRAVLSDRYRPLDYFDLAETALPILQRKECQVISSQLTETHLYIKAVTERVVAEIKVGDTVQAGIVISNSEVGAGAIKIEPLIYTLSCLNGAVINSLSMKKYHVGKRAEEAWEGAQQFFKTETRQADDKAFWLKVRDVIEGTLDQDVFYRIVENMRDATNRPITGKLESVIQVVQEKFDLNESEKGSVLTHLINGGDLSQYGLSNAITRFSQDVDDYERATDFERMGGDIIMLPKHDWELIAEAA